MVDVFFKNEKGMLHFRGGGRCGQGAYLFTRAITGLGPPTKEFNVIGYANQSGQELISQRDMARTITLSVDICSQGQLQAELQRMVGILYHPGTLAILAGNMHRRISCRCTKMDEPEKHGRNICAVVLQLTCDKPYFTDVEPRRATLFSRRDLVSGSLTLPCVFTERISRQTLINCGQVPTEPVLTIYNTQNAAGSFSLLGGSGIELVNHTTGHRLQLDYSTSAGEVITVDIPGRQIVSSLAGDITACIAQDSFLSNFYLEPGENDIEAFNYNTGEAVSILLTYENQYIEAVV